MCDPSVDMLVHAIRFDREKEAKAHRLSIKPKVKRPKLDVGPVANIGQLLVALRLRIRPQ